MAGTERVASSRPAVKLTYQDFLHFPDDGKRHELIDGEHYVSPSPNIRHQRISGNLFVAIRTYLQEQPLGEVFYAPLDVIFSNVDIVEPDLLYVSNARAATALAGQYVRGVPELVIEIASRGTRKRDETIKRRLYESVGVNEYWVVDPAIDVVRVYLSEGPAFAGAVEFRRDAGDTLTTPLMPGF